MGLLGRSKDDSQAARPEFDLVAWAGRHGLEFRDGAPQAGYLSVACPWSVDLLFNVVRGRWPGGTYGVLCHEVRIFEPGTPGYYYGETAKRSAGSKAAGAAGVALDVVGVPSLLTGGRAHVKVPHTSAGARVPHLSTITGLHVARADERCTPESSIWRRRPLDDLELADDWVAAVRKHSDDTVAERLIAGPVREILSTDQGAGFELRVEWGQAVVSQQDFLEPDEELDALVTAADRLPGGPGEIRAPDGGPGPAGQVIGADGLPARP